MAIGSAQLRELVGTETWVVDGNASQKRWTIRNGDVEGVCTGVADAWIVDAKHQVIKSLGVDEFAQERQEQKNLKRRVFEFHDGRPEWKSNVHVSRREGSEGSAMNERAAVGLFVTKSK